MSDPIKVYVSKYALSDGIAEVEVWDNRDGWVVKRAQYSVMYKLGRDAHLTREDAVKDAMKRRDKRVASLKAQITKLEAASF